MQEHGGDDLFNYVVKQDQEIQKGNLTISEWNNRARYIISRIAKSLHYFHYVKNLCHLDMSLENTLIGVVTDNNTGEVIDIIPKIIDFGLSVCPGQELNINVTKGASCTKFVGKKIYKAPKVWYREKFDPCKADVWSFGVMIFMMLLCNPPFSAPDWNSIEFQYIMTGKMEQLIKYWGKWNRMTPLAFDLLKNIFCNENNRYTMEQVMNHPYIKNAPTWDIIKDNWMKSIDNDNARKSTLTQQSKQSNKQTNKQNILS